MFETLLASSTAGAPWIRAVTGALVFHTLLIVGAISGTGSPRAATLPLARDTIRMELAQVRPSLPKGAETSRPESKMIVPRPAGVPEIDLVAPALQLPPFGFSTPGLPQSSQRSLPWASGESAAPGDTSRLIFSTEEVDQLPELVEELHPRYPGALQRAGVSGLVQLEYVVGSDGWVDGRSVRVLHSSHPAFLLAAVEALRKSRFKPARRGGRPTAVLVQQTIRFRYR